MVDQDHREFPAVVRIDRPGRIQDRDAMLERQTRTRSYLPLVPMGDGEREAAGEELTRSWSDRAICCDRGVKVHTRGPCGLIRGQGQALAMRQSFECKLHLVRKPNP